MARPLSERIVALAQDLHWTWCPAAQRLFAALSPVAWKATNHSPLAALALASPARLGELEGDRTFQRLLADAEAALERYHAARPWFRRTATAAQKRLKVAYFCSEYALHESMPQYAGGLGVLAGDHLKSASDLGVPLVGVGLLYRQGYYRQEFKADGSTRVLFPDYNFDLWPLQDTGARITCPLGGRSIDAKVWMLQVGRVPLYLLDADLPENRASDRELTRGLYRGEPELRLRQQILLGIGGILALDAVGEKPTVFHLNEGHAAFCNLERIARSIEDGRTLNQAVSRVRAKTVFTTHTPVPAGHDRYELSSLRWLRPVLRRAGLTQQRLAALGREVPADNKEPLCMTVLALRTSAHVNGVARLHGETSREMWKRAYEAPSSKAVPIGHVTNGVHTPTWLAPQADPLYRKQLGANWNRLIPVPTWWKRASKINGGELWDLRNTLRAQLVQFVRERAAEQAERRGASPEEVAACATLLDKNALTIGFARRFATYKRAPLLFHKPEHLVRILDQADGPVQFLFAGKAHPLDKPGQRYAQKIHRITRRAEFRGRVVLLDDYDMKIGRMLTSGCDVWLNTPLLPYEASGTSGMKPPLHGGLNLSILDGWWPEGFDGRNGWAVAAGRQASRSAQDTADAAELYRLLEEEVIPLFFKRNRHGVPTGWMRMAKRSLATVGSRFSAHRMVGEYLEGYYLAAQGAR